MSLLIITASKKTRYTAVVFFSVRLVHYFNRSQARQSGGLCASNLTAATLPADNHLLQHLLREQRHHLRAAITVPQSFEGLEDQPCQNKKCNTDPFGDTIVRATRG